jgi:hypothetical protein
LELARQGLEYLDAHHQSTYGLKEATTRFHVLEQSYRRSVRKENYRARHTKEQEPGNRSPSSVPSFAQLAHANAA